jgi:hypothetical protein
MVYPCGAWWSVTVVCNSADVCYVSFIQIYVTLFIKRTNVLCYLWSTYVSVRTVKKNAEALVAAVKEIGLEVPIYLSTWSCLEIRMQEEITI